MKKILLYLFFLGSVVSYSQQEASNWYFGENAGIQFDPDTGAVTPLTNGQINTKEGCASISNQNGELLFYTDGSTVYDRSHATMPNGNGLLGDDSSTQSAIVVPKPGDPNIYYIFTVGSNATNTGLKYSEVDMTLNSGFGDITIKNINLLSGCSEKVTAVVQDCMSDIYWVVAFSDLGGSPTSSTGNSFNTFHAYEVSPTGVNTTSVKSNFTTFNVSDSRGYLKLSPDGSKMACANVSSGLYLFDFDTATGMASNDQRLSVLSENTNRPYGVEFSPDSQLLYVSTSNDNFGANSGSPDAHNSRLIQFNLNDANISGTQVIVDDRQLFRGGLQLGPDGRIYRALSATYNIGNAFLGVIRSPNTLGVGCNYGHNAIGLGGNNSTQGLPPFISSFFNEKIDIIQNGSTSTYLPLCVGDTYTLTAENLPGATYEWTLNGDLIRGETGNTLLVTGPGTYEVTIDLSATDCSLLEGEAIVEYFPYPIARNASLFQCDLDDVPDGITTFNLHEADELLSDRPTEVTTTFHYTLDGALNDLDPIFSEGSFSNTINPQIVFVRITNAAGCLDTSELTLEVSTTQVPDFNAPSECDDIDSPDGLNDFDLTLYSPLILSGLPNPPDFEIQYYVSITDALTEINAVTSYSNTNPYSQTIFFRVEDRVTGACYGINELFLSVSELPELEEDETVLYCLNLFPDTITIDAGIVTGNPNDYTYEWSSGQNTFEIQINEIGNYTVTVTNLSGCSNERTITIEPSNTATIDSVEVIDGTADNTVTVVASGEGIYEYALLDQYGIYANFQESNIFENVFPGIYTVRVRDIKNACGITEQLISVIGFPRYFTPNSDGYNDTWQVLGVSEQFQPNSKILIFDRYGKLLKELNPLGLGWNGTYNGNALPNNDYWFAVTLQDGRIYKNHFTLKR